MVITRSDSFRFDMSGVSELAKATFLRRCDEWLCDGYSYDFRYMAVRGEAGPRLTNAFLFITPLPNPAQNVLAIETDSVSAGRVQAAAVSKSELQGLTLKALSGSITRGGHELVLPSDGAYRIQISSIDRNTWFQPLTCQVFGADPGDCILNPAAVDAGLRAEATPFDGIDDLANWLGLRPPAPGVLAAITITIFPPVDLLVHECRFVGDRLRLRLHAHRKADLSKVRLALSAVPQTDLRSRLQVADRITWTELPTGIFEGNADVDLPDATAALTMLLVGEHTVRRHWFLHPTKSPNYRWAAVQQFDSELKMIRQGLFEDADSRRFESAVAALLFMLGFSAAVQLETNSPDLVVATPAGRIVLIECTVRMSDVASKIGKLVDRRGALQKALALANTGLEIAAALICRLPRDQIASRADELSNLGIVLASAEDLRDAIDRAGVTNDPDTILTQALQSL